MRTRCKLCRNPIVRRHGTVRDCRDGRSHVITCSALSEDERRDLMASFLLPKMVWERACADIYALPNG